MKESVDAVYLYIPLMKELGMNWSEIKKTPRRELEGLLLATGTYNCLHAFDGYTSEDVSAMAKDKPAVRSNYVKTLEIKDRMERKVRKEKKAKSFQGLLD